MRLTSKAVLLLLALVASACAVEPGESQSNLPTDAEVEAYNASAAPGERIVCKKEAPSGSHIRRRVCRLERNMNETTAAFHHELRRIRSSTL
jgi:hypothetical protein